ncbi:MAG: RagB/SusD family nutrient uptake outer membrane protein [Prevotella sp.]|nr:RagB/SusD family nutrient uptake outer membrane protein [Prevotella sp.]MBR1464354.1 RagB/SusD family nutrient uptake outer membrane protein [Prevotella sp.]
MTNKIYIALCAAAMALAVSSCGDFLEEKSQDELIPSSAQDLSELLMGVGYPWGNDHGIDYLYLMDDNVAANYDISSESTYTWMSRLFAAFTWQPNMADLPETATGLEGENNSYNLCYTRIMGCNAVLDQIDEASGNTESRNKVKAEALALRSYWYFYLINLYGEPYTDNPQSPGVPLKLKVAIEENSIARNTVAECYDRIVSDITEAISLMGSNTGVTTDYHINVPAMYTLLSRYYLYMGQWEKCASAASEAIRLNPALLDMTTLSSAFEIPVNSFKNPETLWQFGNAEYETYISYDLHFNLSESLLSCYDAADNRLNVFYSQASRTDWSTGEMAQGFVVYKHDSDWNNVSPGSAVRIAEAYLNRAEALVRQNKTEAVNDINRLRRNRIIGYVDVSSVTLDEVLLERRRELSFDYPRWFDLRRTNKPAIEHVWKSSATSTAVTYTLRENDTMYTLPIPGESLSHNTALTQNSSANSGTRAN